MFHSSPSFDSQVEEVTTWGNLKLLRLGGSLPGQEWVTETKTGKPKGYDPTHRDSDLGETKLEGSVIPSTEAIHPLSTSGRFSLRPL